MVKNLLFAIPIATFRDFERLRLNGTTGAFLIKVAHLISICIIKGFEACSLPYLYNCLYNIKV